MFQLSSDDCVLVALIIYESNFVSLVTGVTQNLLIQIFDNVRKFFLAMLGIGMRASASSRVPRLSRFSTLSMQNAAPPHTAPWKIAVRLRVPSYFPPFSFAHRASTAFLAISVRCAGESFAARALPPRDCKARS